ncbi:ubiquinone biosynthesis O-methyltransferase, mitochondrial-like [Octopus sinensis]|uniref:Ubiquinone biosynthesis O-methyltransferase, mitochondrial n=1 Tax=Octopus sinensis TaxID=2607531 RepID=A0A6P7TQ84_9MOLL|nr:ubiquinone biosynthesis O-methyltransferase, mitochondrial-like [Octopus sinensis]
MATLGNTFFRNFLFCRKSKTLKQFHVISHNLSSINRMVGCDKILEVGRLPLVRQITGQQLDLQKRKVLSSNHNLFCCPSRFASIYRNNQGAKQNRPKAQTTIDEEEIEKFSALAQLWWDETGEFEALHSMNSVRVPFIQTTLQNAANANRVPSKSLQGLKILDVGCGGGIFAEPLARLGATVIGIDASEENIRIAQNHLRNDPNIVCKVKYIHSTVEDVVATEGNTFDAVVASEVVEHVADVDTFIESCCNLVKPGGSLFLTTINKTVSSYLLGVLAAERLLHLVAPGTHNWNKFISPMDLQYIIERNNLVTRLVHGLKYNPLTKKWKWSSDTSINYAIHAIKPKS